MDQARVGPDGGGDLVQTGEVDGGHLDAVVGQQFSREFVNAGVADIAEDQVIARFEQAEENGRSGCGSGGGGERIVGVLQSRNAQLQLAHGGIGPARIQKRQASEVLHTVGRESTLTRCEHIVHRHGDIGRNGARHGIRGEARVERERGVGQVIVHAMRKRGN